MLDHRGIKQRLKALQYNLEDVNKNYQNSLIDTHAASGIEYNKKYSIEEMNRLCEAQRELEEELKSRLFTSIFNFTQTFYSIKEYLNIHYSDKKSIIENFFSNSQNRSLPRKAISNDLKHNPENDLIFDYREVEKRTYTEGKTLHIDLKFKKTWFYDNMDSVKICNDLYDELIRFINQNFKSV